MTPIVIAVFGSASTQPNEAEYQTAYEIGKVLGTAGFAVMTGGYKGIMEAASKGAAEAGTYVIGVTSAPIESMRRIKPNAWVRQIVPYDTLRERLIHLVMRADGYVVMPGGLGTFNELLLVWELMRIQEIPPRPLVCFGTYWEQMLAPLRQTNYVLPHYWDLLSFASTPEAVVELIRSGI